MPPMLPNMQPQDPSQMMPPPEQMAEPMPPEAPIMPHSPNPVQDGQPYFMGDHALIKFSSGEEGLGAETYWLVTKSDRTVRPFESPMALDEVFGEDLKEALQSVITVVPPQIDENSDIMDGVLADFSILGPEHMIRDDGTSEPLDFSPHQLKQRYGRPVNEELEGLATDAVDGLLQLMKSNVDKTGIPASFISEIEGDHRRIAFYISAFAYGNYSLADLYKDIKRRFNNSKKK